MYERIIQNITRHVPLTEEEITRFISVIRTKQIRKKQYLLQAGDIMRYECYVTQGCLRSYYVDDNGQERTLTFAFEDWWTGDMYSFLSGNPSRFDVEALEDSTLFLIERQQLEKLYDEIPQLNRHFRILLERAYVAMQNRIFESMSMTAEERYRAFQVRYPQFEQRLSLKHIASYLGITPESLSRIRANKR